MIKSYENDKILDPIIIDAQFKICAFNSILTDYIYHGLNNANHQVLKDRNKSEFEKDFMMYITELCESAEVKK